MITLKTDLSPPSPLPLAPPPYTHLLDILADRPIAIGCLIDNFRHTKRYGVQRAGDGGEREEERAESIWVMTSSWSMYRVLERRTA